MDSGGQAGILALRKAEEQATAKVEKAKQDRAARMKQAKAEADAELESFKMEQQKLLDEMQKDLQGDSELGDMKKKAEIDIAAMEADVKANKSKVVDTLIQVVQKVELVVPEARKGIIA